VLPISQGGDTKLSVFCYRSCLPTLIKRLQQDSWASFGVLVHDVDLWLLLWVFWCGLPAGSLLVPYLLELEKIDAPQQTFENLCTGIFFCRGGMVIGVELWNRYSIVVQNETGTVGPGASWTTFNVATGRSRGDRFLLPSHGKNGCSGLTCSDRCIYRASVMILHRVPARCCDCRPYLG